MNKSSNDHYVPQSILKNFAVLGSNDKVFCLFKDKHKLIIPPRATSVKNLCAEKEFYRFTLDIQDINLVQKFDYDKKTFEKVDSEIAPILNKIIGNGDINNLTDLEKQSLAKYVAYQYMRSPAIKNLAKQFYQNNEDENLIFASNFLDEHFINSVSNILNELNLILIKANQNNQFIISDSPVLLSPTAEGIYFPISPEYCLCYSKYEKAELLDTICINELQFLASVRFNISKDNNVLENIRQNIYQKHIEQFYNQGQTSYWKCILKSKNYHQCCNSFSHEIYEPFDKIIKELNSFNKEVMVKNIISIVHSSLNTNY